MQTLDIEDEDAVRILSLNRPEALNALNAQMIDDLTDAFRSAREDASVRVMLMTGAGKAFWAGADLKEMGTRRTQPKHTFMDMLNAIIDFPKPLVLAVNGVGVGIGATICGLADIVLMSDRARLRCPFSALGLTAEAASTITFPRLLGHQRASWFLLAGEWMDAQTCLASGLALEVHPQEALMTEARGKALVLASLPPASLAQTKSLLLDPIREQLRQAARAENEALARLTGGPANREAIAAFKEKRAPEFSKL